MYHRGPFYAHKTVQSRVLTYFEFKKILESGCQIIAQLCYLRYGHIQDYEKGLNIDGHVVLLYGCTYNKIDQHYSYKVKDSTHDHSYEISRKG